MQATQLIQLQLTSYNQNSFYFKEKWMFFHCQRFTSETWETISKKVKLKQGS